MSFPENLSHSFRFYFFVSPLKRSFHSFVVNFLDDVKKWKENKKKGTEIFIETKKKVEEKFM